VITITVTTKIVKSSMYHVERVTKKKTKEQFMTPTWTSPVVTDEPASIWRCHASFEAAALICGSLCKRDQEEAHSAKMHARPMWMTHDDSLVWSQLVTRPIENLSSRQKSINSI